MTLPIHTPPIAGESWTSYLSRVSRRLGCPVGYLPHHSRGITYPDNIAAVAATYGLDVATVQAMHLQRWEGIAFPAGSLGHQTPRRRDWTAQPPHCPACDHAKLEWHLPWILTCPDHRLHLTCEDQRLRASEAAVERTRYFRVLLTGQQHYAAGWIKPPADVFDNWRDALTLHHRIHRNHASQRSAAGRAALLEEVAPFVLAPTPEQAADVLLHWWKTAHPGRPQASLLHGTTTIQARHAIDAIATDWKRP